MKKVHLSAMALAASAALALTACGGGSASTTPSGSENPAGGEKASIVVDMWAGSEDDIAALDAQIEVARKANPDIDIELRTAPWGDFFTKLTTNMASGNTMLTYYNEDMLTAAGADVPAIGWTFDDFEAIAKAATTGGKYGFGIGMGDFQWQALPIARSGQQPVSETGELRISDPAFVEAAEWYAGLVTDLQVAAPVGSASDGGWGENQFTGENAAMAVDGTWNAVGYLANDAGFKAGMVPLPSGDKGNLSLILGSGYGVAESCENKEAALKVLGSLLSKDAQDSIASSGRSYPARAESQPLYFESLDEAYRDQVKAVFEAAFSQVEGQYVSDNWAKVGSYVQPELVAVYNGQQDMRTVLETAQQQFEN
jgi:multiple sugar transport system substrate-binding protein